MGCMTVSYALAAQIIMLGNLDFHPPLQHMQLSPVHVAQCGTRAGPPEASPAVSYPQLTRTTLNRVLEERGHPADSPCLVCGSTHPRRCITHISPTVRTWTEAKHRPADLHATN